MAGSLRGDFSRLRFDPHKHYSAVHMQQGRVQLDADWNALVDIVAHRLRAQTVDVVGRSGAPAGSDGFRIAPRGALAFDGARDYVSIGHEAIPLYSRSTGFTVEVDITPAEGRGGTLFSRFERTEPDRPLRHAYCLELLPDGRLRLVLSAGAGGRVTTATHLPAGRPCRVALVHDTEGCRLYVDAAPTASLDTGFAPSGIGAHFMLGIAHLDETGNPHPYTGLMREARMWDRALTGDTLRRDPGPGLVGHWRLDQARGGVVLDASGHGHEALLGGGRRSHAPRLVLEDLAIAPGRFYVDGVLCENEAEVPLTGQPDLPGVAMPAERDPGRAYLIYLDAWERYVSALQDPALAEVALGGADTTGRSRVLAQVRWLPVTLPEPAAERPEALPEWGALVAMRASGATLQVRRAASAPALPGNQLYRVEVHAGGRLASATFKWSRDNAAAEIPVAHLDPASPVLAVADTGTTELPVREDGWVEIADEASVLGGLTHDLRRVEAVNTAERSVTLDAPPPAGIGVGAGSGPHLRPWDHAGTTPAGGAVLIAPDTWQPLEHGIEVRFGGAGHCHSADYWTFVARTLGGVEWPTDAAGEPRACRPDGVDHHLAPLALLRFDADGFSLTDCRHRFQPFSEGAVSKAGDRMHGPLRVRVARGDETAAAPAVDVAGTIRGETLLGTLGSPGAVTTVNLAEGAVTRSRIAPDVGTVPVGYAILGHRPEPPPGYEYTGCCLPIPNPQPRWTLRVERLLPEQPGAMHSVVLGGRVYTVAESGRVWAFDPDTHRLEEHRGLSTPRRAFGVGAANGRLYVFGGVDANGRRLGDTLELDPATDAWVAGPDMPAPRSHHAVASVDERLYVIGGLRDMGFLEVTTTRMEAFDPRANAWSRRGALPRGRYRMAASGASQRLHAFGGQARWFLRWRGRRIATGSYEYLPAVDRWTTKAAPLPTPWCAGAAVAMGERILLVGGRSVFGASGEVAEYTPEGDSWTYARALPGPAPGAGAAAVDGRLIVHTVGATPSTLVVQECLLAPRFFVHRKCPGPPGDLEPQLRPDGDAGPEDPDPAPANASGHLPEQARDP